MRVNKEGQTVDFSKEDTCGKRLVISKKMTGFGDNLMGNITWLAYHPKEKIEVEEGNPVFYMKDGCLIDRTTKTLVLAEIGAKMPQDGSIEHIGEYAFCCHNEIGGPLIVPDGVKTIGSSAFSDCVGLLRVGIPESVEQIASTAFNGCDGLECIAVREGPSYYEKGNCIIEKKTNAVVVGCKTSKIPEGVVAIGESAFSEIETLESIVVPDSVKRIEDGAFEYCTALKQITLPERVDFLGSDVFRGCTSLESIALPMGAECIDMYMFKECGMLKEVSIPESVTSIEVGAFEDCYSLGEIEIPQSVEVIGTWAFYNCKSLKKVTLAEGVKAICREAFAGCPLEEFVLPESLEELGEGACKACIHIENIVIPKNVKKIGEGAFFVCMNLKKAVFEDPSGWVYNGRLLKEEELRDPALAAEYLIHKYRYLDWKKV